MRHQKSGRKLNRTSSHRQAMFRNMAASLFRHEQIRTTLPKAKELRRVAEPLITLAKTSSVANRRLAFARLRDRMVVGKLFDELGVRFKNRPGGYLRILKCGFRPGDKAPMAIVQLVEMAKASADTGGKNEDAKPKKAKATDVDAVKTKEVKTKEVKTKESKQKETGSEKKETKATAKKTAKKKTAKKKTVKKAAAKKTAAKKTAKKKTAKKKTAKKKKVKKK